MNVADAVAAAVRNSPASHGACFLPFGHYMHLKAYELEKPTDFLYARIELPARDFRYPLLGVTQFLSEPCLGPTTGPHNGFQDVRKTWLTHAPERSRSCTGRLVN